MKKYFKVIGILLLISILFRGGIYRFLISYTTIGTREKIEITNPKLLEIIDLKTSNKVLSFTEIVNLSRSITIDKLSFSRSQISRNPNQLIETNLANCTGYSALFNSIANHLIRTNNLEQKYAANHRIGRLELLGFNVHQLFSSSFFQDHDFNEIVDLQTETVISVDPSVSDYLGIDYVRR